MLRNFLLFGNLFAVLTSFFIVFISSMKREKTNVHKFFILFNISIGLWCLGAFVINNMQDSLMALYFHRFCYLGGIIVVPAFIFLVYGLINQKPFKLFHKIIYFTAIILIIFLPTKFFIKTLVYSEMIPLLQASPGPVYYLFMLYLTIGVGGCLLLLYRNIQNALLDSSLKNQMQFIFSAYLIQYVGGAIYFATILRIFKFFTPAGYLIALGCAILFYAISKHRLMDIDLVWRYLLEKVLYFLVTASLLGLGWKFLFRKPFDPSIFFIISICVIFIPIIRSALSRQLKAVLLRKYTTVWKKLESMAASKENLYSIKDIASVLVIDIPKIMSLKKSGYYKYSESDFCYESLFSKNNNDLINFDHPIVARMKEENGCINRDHLRDSLVDDKLLKNLMEKSGFSLAYSIFSGDLIIGIVIYGEKTNNQLYHNEELEQLASIIKKAQEQIHNVLHLEYLSNNYAEEILQKYKTTYQMQLLRETRKIGAIRDIDELTTHIVSLVNRSVNAEYTYLYLYDETKRVYTLQKGSKQNLNLPLFVKEEQHLMKHLRQNKDILLYDTLKKWADDAPFQAVQEAESLARQLEATIIVPLIDITLLGFLVIGNKRDEGRFTNDDFFVMSFIADRSEMNISNVLIREKAERDSLTGLHNKGYLTRRTKEEVANCLKFGGSVSYLMIDADDFKWFNDYHSHMAGDEVLVGIVNAIKSSIRPSDEFCRYGGEEFPILITGLSDDDILSMGNKVLAAVRHNDKINELVQEYKRKITVSIGIATFRPFEKIDEFTNEEIFRISSALVMRADMALKQAKKNGKDQFQVTPPFSRGEEGDDSDIFSKKVLIISTNDLYQEMRISGADLDVLSNIDEAFKICELYDMVLFDMPEENVNVMNSIKSFRDKNRNLVVGVFTEFVKYKAEIESVGGKFLTAPLDSHAVEEWIIYLKQNQVQLK